MAIKQLESPLFKSVLTTTGLPNDSGYVYVYEVGGSYLTNQVTTWTDKNKTSQHTQPIQLNAAGEEEIWFDGTVDIRVEDSANTLQYTLSGVESSTTPSISGEFNLVTNGGFEVDSDGDSLPDSWDISENANATIAIDSSSGNQHSLSLIHI